MDSKGKSHEVEAIPTPSLIATRKKDKKRKNRKESDEDEMTALIKKVDQIGNSLNELTELVKKLDKNSDLKKKEKEYVCLFESKDSDMKHRGSIFVRGFNCSFPIDDIKSTLIKHFSSCGEVMQVFIPYQCKSGSPLGFGFINMVEYPDKALVLNGSYLGGMKLEVMMAIKSKEYHQYPNFRGCKRCRNALVKRFQKSFYARPRF